MIAAGFTAHATHRLQQRAIPSIVVDLLEKCGTEKRCAGGYRLLFDKAAMKRLKRHLGGERNMRIIERWLGVYAVVADNGKLVTVAHKLGRYRRA